MITSIEQATAVQTRRVAAKKRGYSKAVRTFLVKECTDVNSFNVQEYTKLRDAMPVTWIKPEVKKDFKAKACQLMENVA